MFCLRKGCGKSSFHIKMVLLRSKHAKAASGVITGIIRIHHEFVERIDKSVPSVTVLHHEAPPSNRLYF